MGIITNRNKTKSGIGIFIIWIITVGMLLCKCGWEIYILEWDIIIHTPVFAEEPHGTYENLPSREDDSQIQYEENEDSQLQEEPRELQEKHEKRIILILSTALVCLYLVLGIVGFALLRRKEDVRSRIYIWLIIVNSLAIILIPLSPLSR